MRKNDTGASVSLLQRYLQQAGFKIEATGLFDDATEAAVIAFQTRVGLVVDGDAGPKTIAALATRATDPRHQTQANLEQAAQRLGVPVASVMAVNSVETIGQGFLPDGRPIILFERHKLYELLEDSGADVEALAARYPGIINRLRGGYTGGVAEWGRLTSAKQATANYPGLAEQACSWGAFQIMGFHWRGLGYASVDEFIEAMSSSEGQQLGAFIRFIEADPALLKALKARKWADFARLYNGPAYKENLYDVKLARAFERFSPALPEA